MEDRIRLLVPNADILNPQRSSCSASCKEVTNHIQPPAILQARIPKRERGVEES